MAVRFRHDGLKVHEVPITHTIEDTVATSRYDGCITTFAEYGEHIPLTCVNHPTLRWHTKNIAPIGARTIFYDTHANGEQGLECTCPLSALVSVDEKEWSELLALEAGK